MLETINLDNGLTTAGLSLAPFGSLFTQSGVLRPTAFAVSALTSPGMFVEVSGSDDGDIAIIKTEDGSTYFVRNTLPLQVPILANTSGVTKTDAIVLFVDLTAGDDENAGSPGAAQVIAVRRGGISTGLPTDGEIDAETGNNPWIFLKGVQVEHGAGEVEAEDLTGAPDRAYVVTDLVEPGSIVEALLGPGAVTEGKISSNAIKLGYAQVTTAQNAVTSGSDLTGLSITVTAPTSRGIKITAYAPFVTTTTGNVILEIKEGSTVLNIMSVQIAVGSRQSGALMTAFIASPTAGTHTYKLSVSHSAGTVNMNAGATLPAYILAEAV